MFVRMRGEIGRRRLLTRRNHADALQMVANHDVQHHPLSENEQCMAHNAHAHLCGPE